MPAASRHHLLLLAALIIGALVAPTRDGPSADPAAATAECRFLALDGDEARLPLAPERLAALLQVLRRSRIGGVFADQLERYHRDGFGTGDRRLGLFEVQRAGGPAAEYFETGDLYLRSGFLEDLRADAGVARAELYTAASFVVHEMVHAIAHHLYLIGELPVYQANTKVNEALAFFIQGLFLEELRASDPRYREVEAVPAWDECTARIVRILKDYGITEATGRDQAYDRIAEWQLAADEPTALRLARLWQYYEFIAASGESDALWRFGDRDPPRQRVVEALTGMIGEDVQARSCNLRRTFAFMRDRIILYAHYPDTPLDVTACEYFGGFVRAFRRQSGVAEVLGEAIDQWLTEHGLRLGGEAGP